MASTLEITLPVNLQKRIAARAAESGFDNIESYVQSLLEADASEQELGADVEALLLRRLRSRGSILLTPEFERRFKRNIERRRRGEKR